ncbi:MAG TPA: response regulator transcription factor [Polyangiaceae bacterium LLY-WYZ-15_(1-7)]|nr:DNA-binding response regulator [Sandaracinus sp.]HJK93901.1 response regulator transcription factor [Polyangiaceae bacterium LLY-WYZ-15_(1-7)]HJL01852.1 response regulator transcription factor [Polyangiaceae bacterium LLY-WYZ-15_(1-7)]HJL12951.1 response regulator transcription factor [Polyangiaceae bacterium LLY-WYZ-15_(1-7)]HJL20623.1 response regulator transcription factor [Polyangiaceae bacterium LLY-WYZ-15_(1-7)]
MSGPTRVVVADDHPVVVRGLERFATIEPDLDVVGTASDADAVPAVLRETRPHVVSLDVQMPGMVGPSTIESIAREGVPILLFTFHPIDAELATLMEAGARGYVPKSATLEDFHRAAATLRRGERVLPRELGALLDERAATGLGDALTTREREVLDRLARFEAPKEIAHALGLSPSTVYTYRERIRAKLGIRTQADLVAYATRRR